MQNVQQWHAALYTYPSHIFRTKCNEHTKTTNALYLSLDLKGLLEIATWTA